jgi:hypothetical protein
MTIATGDIQILASSVMTDDDEGGGAPTATQIVDGASNAIFPDLEEVERAGGRFRLRKLFIAVNTATTDTFGGANVIVSDIPGDANVSVTLMKADDYFETRTTAADRVEAYLYRSTVFGGYLLQNHIKGMKSLQICQRPGASLPTAGQTLFLVQNEGDTDEFSQYVRIKTVSSTTATVTVSTDSGYTDITVQIVTCELTSALEYTFKGTDYNRLFKAASSAAVIRSTMVANATSYYGASATTAAVAIGDTSATVASVYSRLVPAAQSETALTDKSLTGDASPMVAAADGTVSRTVTIKAFAAGATYTLPTGCYPGSLAVVTPSGTLSDDGAGNVLLGSGAAGTITYSSGAIVLTTAIAGGTVTETYRPAASVSQQAYTDAVEVTAESRAYTYTKTMSPVPSPGTLVVSYLAGGNWYQLSDDGSGTLSGTDSSYGVGKLTFTTGTLAVTLGALPDVGSYVIFAWGTNSESITLTTSVLNIAAPKIAFDLEQAVEQGSFKLSWTSGGVAQTATDDGTGNITGDATGVIYYASGSGYVRTTQLPDSAAIGVTYNKGAYLTLGATTSEGTTWTGTLGTAAIKPGTVSATCLLKWAAVDVDLRGYSEVYQSTQSGTIRDDGAGGLYLEGYGTLTGSSINYTTGAVVLVVNYQSTVPQPTYSSNFQNTMTFTGYSVDTASREIASGGIAWKWRLASDDDTTATVASIDVPTMTLTLNPYLSGTIVSGSLRFRLGSYTYVDRSGVLYHSIDPATGAGTEAGTVSYSGGTVTITAWPSGAFSFALQSGLIKPGSTGMSSVIGFTTQRPLKSQSFQINATSLSGTTISATAAADGSISGSLVTGSINYDTGVYVLTFGKTVSSVWSSTLVDPSTMRYNAVAYSYLPLDSSIIGIDPVRLPTDGRVQIFKSGDYVVLGNTQFVSKTVANGDVVNLGRTRLSRVWILGNDASKISTGYTVDLDAGTVTFTDVSGYSQPVTLYDRIEDMAMLSDAQISGEVTFTRKISHAYPVGSMLSTALYLGDQYAHVKTVFDQATWDGTTWQDTVNGDGATASYDKTNYPIAVTNAGTVTENWCIKFTNTTSFQVIGEHLGIIGTGTTGASVTPSNPNSTEPYFTLDYRGWGQGWAAGNCLFFKTVAAGAPVWVAQTIQQGTETVTDDKFTLIVRGDVDKA